MKTLAILILLCASSYGADIITTNTTADITTIIYEHRDGDGKPWHIERVFRGKTKIMMIVSHPDKQGVMTATRSYIVGGKVVMVESDENGDGVFESVTVFDPTTNDFEMFIRQPDGSVKPISTQTLKVTKKQAAIGDETARKMFQKPDMTDKELNGLLEENRQKMESLEKEKQADKK
jgi:hypothetical protein